MNIDQMKLFGLGIYAGASPPLEKGVEIKQDICAAPGVPCNPEIKGYCCSDNCVLFFFICFCF